MLSEGCGSMKLTVTGAFKDGFRMENEPNYFVTLHNCQKGNIYVYRDAQICKCDIDNSPEYEI